MTNLRKIAQDWFNRKLKEKTEHSPIGPSSAGRWMQCPASVAFSIDLPDTPTGYAAEGTAAHLVTEFCRLQGVEAEELVGLKVGDVEISKAMSAHCQEFVDLCGEFDGEMLVEELVHFDEYAAVKVKGKEYKGFGTADDIRLREGHAVITDFKYGRGVGVEAKGNHQLMLLALGVHQTYGFYYEIERFTLCIHQPRAGGWKSVNVSLKQLLKWEEKVLRPAVEAVNSANAEFKASTRSDGHCRFCRAKNRCKARLRSFVDGLPDRAEIVPGEMGLVLKALEGVQQFHKDLKDEAATLMKNGIKVMGMKLVSGRSSRSWKDPQQVIRHLVDTEGYNASDCMVEPALKSVHQMEKMLTASERRSIEGMVSITPGPPTAVFATDKRPSVEVDPEKEFEGLDTR